MNDATKSETTLRVLFENMPDFVALVDRNSHIRFANRNLSEISRESLPGKFGLDLTAPEYREAGRRALEQAFDTGLPQTVESQDIFGRWWSVRVVPLVGESGVEHAMVICADVTQERLAVEAIKKEQRLLRQLLDLHERERQLIAYEIHDGFAQQLTGALFRLQAFRETFARDSAEAWKSFDSAAYLLRQAIDEARRLISDLRPPILDEMGVVEAVQYLVYEHRENGGPEIEFNHDLPPERLAPPLENAIFRIVQELLRNACRHSRSDRIQVALAERDGLVRVDVRDWGIGFQADAVEEQRFGLQGVRERVRLLDGRMVIESAPNKGTHIFVELPLVNRD